LSCRVSALNISCPYDATNHRPFVREFVAAVHQITGQLFSPPIYRRLLDAYVPQRKPSTAPRWPSGELNLIRFAN
jgi:hypothetical protein